MRRYGEMLHDIQIKKSKQFVLSSHKSLKRTKKVRITSVTLKTLVIATIARDSNKKLITLNMHQLFENNQIKIQRCSFALSMDKMVNNASKTINNKFKALLSLI